MPFIPSRLLTPWMILATLAGSLAVRAAPPATVSFRALCFDPRETETPVWFLSRGGARKALEIDKSRISGRQTASVRDGRFVDFHPAEVPQEGERPPLTLTLPAGSLQNLLFVFAPASTGYRAWAIQLSPAEFKAGDTLLVNAAPVAVAVRLGAAKPVTVQSGASGILPVPSGFKEPMVPVRIFERNDSSEPWRIAQSTRWAVDSRFRSYLFLYHAPQHHRLLLHGVTERIDNPDE